MKIGVIRTEFGIQLKLEKDKFSPTWKINRKSL
jgi:hypothetical protein